MENTRRSFLKKVSAAGIGELVRKHFVMLSVEC